MKNIKTSIRILRALEKDLGLLNEGELGFAIDTNKLYIGDPTEGNVCLNELSVSAIDIQEIKKSVAKNTLDIGSILNKLQTNEDIIAIKSDLKLLKEDHYNLNVDIENIRYDVGTNDTNIANLFLVDKTTQTNMATLDTRIDILENAGAGNIPEITKNLQTSIDGKVSKEPGKSLSANDFTNDLRTKLVGIDMSSKVDVVPGKSLIDDTEIERLKTVDNYNDVAVKEDIKMIKNNIPLPTTRLIIISTDIIPGPVRSSIWTSTNLLNLIDVKLSINLNIIIKGVSYNVNRFVFNNKTYSFEKSVEIPYSIYINLDKTLPYITIYDSEYNEVVYTDITYFKITQNDFSNKITKDRIESIEYSDLQNKPSVINQLINGVATTIPLKDFNLLLRNNIFDKLSNNVNNTPYSSDTSVNNRVISTSDGRDDKYNSITLNNIYDAATNKGRGLKINLFEVTGLTSTKMKNVYFTINKTFNCIMTVVDPEGVSSKYDLSTMDVCNSLITPTIKEGFYYFLFAKKTGSYTSINFIDIILYTESSLLKSTKNFSKFIPMDNNVPYEVIGDYNPASKKYVDATTMPKKEPYDFAYTTMIVTVDESQDVNVGNSKNTFVISSVTTGHSNAVVPGISELIIDGVSIKDLPTTNGTTKPIFLSGGDHTIKIKGHFKLTDVNNTKSLILIKDVVLAKDLLTTKEMFKGANIMNGIPSIDMWQTRSILDMSNMFEDTIMGTLDLTNVALGSVKTTRGMFKNSSITELSLPSNFCDANNDIGEMFRGCVSLKVLDCNNASTFNIQVFDRAFESCRSLTTLNNNFTIDTTNGRNMSKMFFDCSSLMNLPEIIIVNATDISYMFAQCVSLNHLDLSNFILPVSMTNTEKYTGIYNNVTCSVSLPIGDERSYNALLSTSTPTMINLGIGNDIPFTPELPYEPVTKNYVDNLYIGQAMEMISVTTDTKSIDISKKYNGYSLSGNSIPLYKLTIECSVDPTGGKYPNYVVDSIIFITATTDTTITFTQPNVFTTFKQPFTIHMGSVYEVRIKQLQQMLLVDIKEYSQIV